MRHVRIARLSAAALLLHVVSASAGQIEIDLPAALDRAHRGAPDAVAARGQIAIAKAAVAGANVAFIENPEIEGGGGPRLTASRPIDLDLRVAQDLELGRRSPRRAVARAGVVQTKAEVDAVLRTLDLEVTSAFYEALHAERTAELSRRTEELAQKATEVAERRRKAGDITDLDLNLARIALGRARSATQATAADRANAIGRLAAVIGATPDDVIVLRGDLTGTVPDLPALRAALANRPDVRVLEAESAVARAEGDQARANGRMQLSLWANYRREDTDSIIAGGIRFTLPIWNRAQGDKATASAKARRATDTRDAVLRVADRQLADAIATYASAKTAVEVFERDVVPLLNDSEQLLQKSLDGGQLAVNDYLVARQEIVSGRREHLDRLLAVAKAAAVVRFVGGAS